MDRLQVPNEKPLRILILEDSQADAMLIRHHLTEADIQATYAQATNEEEFLMRLEQESFDLILADYYLRGFDAITAMDILQEKEIEVPVILISGQVGEEIAAESLHAGAIDYLFKDKLVRLGPAVRRALAEHQQQKHSRRIEAEMQRQAEILAKGEQVAQFGAFEVRLHERNMFWTPGVYTIFELDPAIYTPNISDIPHLFPFWEEVHKLVEVQEYQELPDSFSLIQKIHTLRGKSKYCRISGDIIEEDQLLTIIGIVQDITKEYEADLALRKINDELEERVEARTKALRESEEKYRLITENMVDMVTLQNPQGAFTFASSSIRQLLGYAPTDIVGQQPDQFIHPEDLNKLVSKGMEINRLTQPQIIRFKHIGGEYIWLETLTTGLYDDQLGLIGLQTISRHISERRKEEEQTRKAIPRQRELTKLRSDFVSIASHQFRTPLAVIRSNTQLLDMICREYIPSNSRTLFFRAIDRIEGEISRLLELMDDVLILGQHNAGQMSPRLAPTYLHWVLTALIQAEFSPGPDGRHINLELDEDLDPIMADSRLLEHAFSNLLTNALKYSANCPEPLVRAWKSSKEVYVSIRDFGIGIPAEELPHLFDPFFRGKDVQHIKGTGLGLSIADQFLRLNNGYIKVSSTPQAGSEFVVSFPIITANDSTTPASLQGENKPIPS